MGQLAQASIAMLAEMHELQTLGRSIWWHVERGLGEGREEDEKLGSSRDLKHTRSVLIREWFTDPT